MERQGPVRLTGMRGAADALVCGHLIRAHRDRPVLVIAANAKASDRLLEDLRAVMGEQGDDNGGGRLRTFPHHDTSPYDRFSPQPFVIAQRMARLYEWLVCPNTDDPAPVVIAPWTALALRVPARSVVRARSLHLEVGQTTDRDALVATLLGGGYSRMSMVEERGELAVRGGILDLFPPQRANPVRIELLGDQVESIREFDPGSQRSRGSLSAMVAAPPRELLFDRAQVIERSDALRALAPTDEDQAAVDELVDGLLRGHIPPGAEAIAPALQPRCESLLDYLPDNTLIAIADPDPGRDRLLQWHADALDNYAAAREAGRPVCAPGELMLPAETLLDEIEARHPVYLERMDIADGDPGISHYSLRAYANDDLRRELVKSRTQERALVPLADRLAGWMEDGWRISLCVPSLSAAERLRELLGDYGFAPRVATDARPAWRWSGPRRLEIRVAPISEGFAFPLERLAVVTEEEIFGPRERRRTRKRWREGAAVEALAQLSQGDFLVHADHGIGAYRGLVTLNLRGFEADFLRIEYEGNDRLFLPIDRLNLIQRYAGSDAGPARLDRMGGSTWERTKRNVKKSLRDMAKQLLSVHAARELAPGHAYPAQDHYFEEFEAAFPFEETPDQASAIFDVMADMTHTKPMDRLVCGDVGYGKTEVAMRAAFRVVMNGRQVAILVPTTILAQQHLETFRKRFEGYPVRIDMLSRFRSPKESKQVMEGIATGEIDIVIGTHRLLNKQVQFRELGLLVVDEEHRFGVAHKERIKQLKKTVDVLTLTATPIPRTLQQAFTGIRDLSVIETPPADRLAIRTQLCRFSESLVREAILREVRRGGQVYFVHNRVHSIGATAELLRKIVPEVSVLVAHGQMRERELEARMLAFFHGEADVLLSTSIIESGLDLPRANTIIVHRADTFGLAQLYQLRGRVGRSSRRAYAYLLVRNEESLSKDAERRLEAIQDLSELGSGFRLANMDLEIRGAGNLLGGEQSGNLTAVGYETYMEMLEETVEEMRGHMREVEIDPEIRFPLPARLPESYVPDINQRLVLYKRLASAREDSEVDLIRDEILDRFGHFPPEVEHLIEVLRIKNLARRLRVSAVDWNDGDLVVTAAEGTRIDPQRLVNLLSSAGSNLRVTPDHRIYARVGDGEPKALFGAARRLLVSLGAEAA